MGALIAGRFEINEGRTPEFPNSRGHEPSQPRAGSRRAFRPLELIAGIAISLPLTSRFLPTANELFPVFTFFPERQSSCSVAAMNVVWTDHAQRRLAEWSRRREITREAIEAIVRSPDQVVAGHAGLQVAQSKMENGLWRVPFFDLEGGRKIVTVYWTSRINRYWEE